MSWDAGEANIDITADASGVRKGTQEAETIMASFQTRMRKLATEFSRALATEVVPAAGSILGKAFGKRPEVTTKNWQQLFTYGHGRPIWRAFPKLTEQEEWNQLKVEAAISNLQNRLRRITVEYRHILENVKVATISGITKGIQEAKTVLTAFQARLKQIQARLKQIREVFLAVWSKMKLPIAAGAVLGFMIAKKGLDAILVQEEALVRLRGALETSGAATDYYMNRLVKFSARMQKATVYGDELTQSLMAQALTAGATADELETLITYTYGIAEQMKKVDGGVTDVSRALRATMLAMAGEYTMLQRYSTELKTANTQEEKHAVFLAAVSRGLSDLSARTRSGMGVIQQMRMAWSDLKEEIGRRFLDKWLEVTNKMKEFFESKDAESWAKAVGDAFDDVLNNINKLLSGMKKLHDFFGWIVGAPGKYVPEPTTPTFQQLAVKKYEKAEAAWVKAQMKRWGWPEKELPLTSPYRLGRREEAETRAERGFARTAPARALREYVKWTAQLDKAVGESAKGVKDRTAAEKEAALRRLEAQKAGLTEQIALEEKHSLDLARLKKRAGPQFYEIGARWEAMQMALLETKEVEYDRRIAAAVEASDHELKKLNANFWKVITAIKELKGEGPAARFAAPG